VTGAANTVVTVWDLGKKQFTIRQHLYGHTEAVPCLAASAGYQILVSGSRDRTAIVWDLSRLTFIRQLTGHNVPLATIDINDLTGDIATCSGTWLHLWSINGDPLASVNTLVGRICRSQHILCVCFSQFNEWDPMNMILTGSTDGVVRMWPLDHVQVQKVDQMLCLLILNLLFECCRFLMRKHPHK
jgi:WD40 repeat protein